MKTWAMDPCFLGCTDFSNDIRSDDGSMLFNSFHNYPFLSNENELQISSHDLNFSYTSFPPDLNSGIFMPSSNISPDCGSISASTSVSNSDENDFFEPVLKYISQMLMEENMEESHTFHDPLALQETEKSLYEVLGQQYPCPNSQPQHYTYHSIESPDGNFSSGSNDFSVNGGPSISSNSAESQWPGCAGESTAFLQQAPDFGNHMSQPALLSTSKSSFNCTNSFTDDSHFLSASMDPFLVQKMFSDPGSMLLFKKGLQEASKFIPDSSRLIIDVDKKALPVENKEVVSKVDDTALEGQGEDFANGLSGRKNHHRDDTTSEEERSNKQSAPSSEEIELSGMFDKVFICSDSIGETVNGVDKNEATKVSRPNEKSSRSRGSKSSAKKQGKKKKETVDLRTLLVLSAQAISSDDGRNATQLLKQIRQHSSPTGDGSQRLAHYFANGLEARLNGNVTETQDFFTKETLMRSRPAAALKTFEVYFTSCPFRKFTIYYANKMIVRAAENARTLHVVDFGILYGFNWPILIQLLANRPGGPPKLRITGIEFPQRGFRPTERVDKTGRRLEDYCERFGVPFEYNGIASQKWETIDIDDFKLGSNEVLAVNCPVRFQSLLDETVEVNSPRDAVLKLVRKLNPNIVVHTVVNATHHTPFFLSRFRESLFHFSALFDMFDTIVPCDNEERLNFEREYYGREIMNVIACEGSERIDRPETYKQWQVRNVRAGFKLLPLEKDLLKELKARLKADYNKDFVIDEDSNWMLLGWRGRIIYATSCWVSA